MTERTIPPTRPPLTEFISRSIESSLLRYPKLDIPLRELYGFDPDTFKHALCVREIAQRIFLDYALSVHLPRRLTEDTLNVLGLAAILHDIGKVGISPNGLSASLAQLYPSKKPVTSSKLQLGQDQLTAEERAIMCLHPLIGGMMVKNIADYLGIQDPEIIKTLEDLTYGHHEKTRDSNGYRASYPRPEGARKKSPMTAILDIVLKCADMADSMRAPRPYRAQNRVAEASLSPNIIRHELQQTITPELIKLAWPSGEIDIHKIISFFLESTFKNLNELDSIIKTPAKDLINLYVNRSSFEPIPLAQAHILPMWISQVWSNKSNLKRIDRLLKSSMQS